MRVVFMGTPQIAADCLSRLIADGFDLVGVYTKPDMPKNRGMKLAMSEVKEVADYVTDDVVHDGTVTAMRHFGLI